MPEEVSAADELHAGGAAPADQLEIVSAEDIRSAVSRHPIQPSYLPVQSAREAAPAPAPARAPGNRSLSVSKSSGAKSVTFPKLRKETPGQPTPAATEIERKPKVVYTGFLKLQVKRLLEAVDELTRITEEKKGYVESLTERVVVVRIPADDFEQVMTDFAAVGKLLEKRVSALDVTAQFTDLTSRLHVAEEARQRLLALLEKVIDLNERLRILEQINRLSEQIDSINSTLTTLRNLLDYYTITIELQPILANTGAVQHRSPFAWITSLAAHRPSATGDGDDITLMVPDKFVHFDEEEERFLARAADTTAIRIGQVDNEPLGDARFWIEAVDFEMVGRGMNHVDQGEQGRIHYRTYESQDAKPYYYLVGVSPVEDELYVVEVFYPHKAAFDAHHGAVIQALLTFEVN